jgi:hypothetical protein
MKYEKTFSKNKLYPKAKYILSNIPDIYYFGNKHPYPCRPPLAIYNIAEYELLKSLEDAIVMFEQYNKDVNVELYFNGLLDKCEKIIANICSLYDECFLILISLSDQSNKNPKIAYDWLKENGYDSGSLLKSYCYESIKTWQEIYNRLKHNNQRLSYLFATENENHVEGFFIEGYTKDGSIGLDPTFHSKENNMSQGISFKKFFKEIFFSYYYISDNILKVVEHHLKKYHNHKLDYKITTIVDDSVIRNLWDKISAMNYVYFYDEYEIKYTIVTKYKISYPNTKILFNFKATELKVKFSADGVTKNYQFPMIK